MRPFGNKRTHTSDGQELSDLFIGEDGKLSVYYKDDECEVVGFVTTIFCDCFEVKLK